MSRLPREARDGIMRVWLEILREKHPEYSWVAVEPGTKGAKAVEIDEVVERAV